MEYFIDIFADDVERNYQIIILYLLAIASEFFSYSFLLLVML